MIQFLQSISNTKFIPSQFALMLIRVVNGDENRFELIEHTFDSHLKLLLRSQDKTLPAGKYIIMVAPQWNDEASLAPSFKKVTTGIYAPV